MKKKLFLIFTLLILILGLFFSTRIFCGQSADYCIYINTVKITEPGIGILLPLLVLSVVSLALKNISFRAYALTLSIYSLLVAVILPQIEPECSTIFCFTRNLASITFSSIFSLVYLVVLLFQNRKKLA